MAKQASSGSGSLKVSAGKSQSSSSGKSSSKSSSSSSASKSSSSSNIKAITDAGRNMPFVQLGTNSSKVYQTGDQQRDTSAAYSSMWDSFLQAGGLSQPGAQAQAGQISEQAQGQQPVQKEEQQSQFSKEANDQKEQNSKSSFLDEAMNGRESAEKTAQDKAQSDYQLKQKQDARQRAADATAEADKLEAEQTSKYGYNPVATSEEEATAIAETDKRIAELRGKADEELATVNTTNGKRDVALDEYLKAVDAERAIADGASILNQAELDAATADRKQKEKAVKELNRTLGNDLYFGLVDEAQARDVVEGWQGERMAQYGAAVGTGLEWLGNKINNTTIGIENPDTGEEREIWNFRGAGDKLEQFGSDIFQNSKAVNQTAQEDWDDGTSTMSDFEKSAASVGKTVANTVEDMVVNLMLPGAGSKLMATRVAGAGALEQDQREGHNDLDSRATKALLDGGAALLSNWLIGGASAAYNKSVIGKAIGEWAGAKGLSPMMQRALNTEGIEEVAELGIGYIGDRVLGLVDKGDSFWSDWSWREAAQEYAVGYFLGFLLNAGAGGQEVDAARAAKAADESVEFGERVAKGEIEPDEAIEIALSNPNENAKMTGKQKTPEAEATAEPAASAETPAPATQPRTQAQADVIDILMHPTGENGKLSNSQVRTITSDPAMLQAFQEITGTAPDTSSASNSRNSIKAAGAQYIADQQKQATGEIKSGELPRMSMEDFANNDSPVWNNIDYNDEKTKIQTQQEAHDRMVNEGKIVVIPESTSEKVSESFPDLRGMKKKERVPILKEKLNTLKKSLRSFLTGLKNKGSFEFEVNGNILEAKLYDTGIKEVLQDLSKNSASMLYHSADIFKNAEYLYSTPDYDNDSDIYRWNYFYTPVQFGDEVVGVRIAVRDMIQNPESQIYNWGIKQPQSLGGGAAAQTSVHSNASSDSGVLESADSSDTNVPQDQNSVNTESGEDAGEIGESADQEQNEETGEQQNLESNHPFDERKESKGNKNPSKTDKNYDKLIQQRLKEMAKNGTKKRGTVSFDGGVLNGQKVDGVDPNNLTKQQKSAIKAAQAVADALGLDIVFFSEPEKDGNIKLGAWQGDKLYLNMDGAIRANKNGQTTSRFIVGATLSHELTHYLQKYDAEGYAQLRDFVEKTILEKDAGSMEKMIRQSIAMNPSLSPEEAMDEIVANACQEMLYDNEVVKQLARQNMNLFEKIVDIFDSVGNRLKGAFAEVNLDDSDIYRAARLMKGEEETLKRIWSRDLLTATENFQNQQGQVKTAPEGGKTQFMAVDENNNVIVDEDVTPGKVRATLEAIASGDIKDTKFTFPILKHTPQVYLDHCDLGDRSFVMHATKAKESMLAVGKHGHNMGPDGVMDIIERLYQPDYIIHEGGKKHKGHYVAIFTNDTGDVVAAVDLRNRRFDEGAVAGETGYYNVLITVYDDLLPGMPYATFEEYVDSLFEKDGNTVVYDKYSDGEYEAPEDVDLSEPLSGLSSGTSSGDIVAGAAGVVKNPRAKLQQYNADIFDPIETLTEKPKQTDKKGQKLNWNDRSGEETKTSEYYSNTNTKNGKAKDLNETDFKYVPIDEQTSMRRAASKVANNYDEVLADLYGSRTWMSEQVDAAWIIADKLYNEAIATGTKEAHDAFDRFEQMIQDHATEAGAALQAFAKQSRPGSAGVLRVAHERIKAIREAKAEAERKGKTKGLISDEALKKAEEKTREYATRMGRLEYDIDQKIKGGMSEEKARNSAKNAYLDLIDEINAYRHTGLIQDSGKMASTREAAKANKEVQKLNTKFRRMLENESMDYIMRFAACDMAGISADTQYEGKQDFRKRLNTWQKLAQLTGTGTWLRNGVGNGSFGIVDVLAADNPVTWIADALLSTKTGKRASAFETGFLNKAARDAAAHSLRRSILEVAANIDLDTDSDTTKYDMSTTRTYDPGSENILTRLGSRWEQWNGYMLQSSDAWFKGMSKGSAESAIRRANRWDKGNLTKAERASMDKEKAEKLSKKRQAEIDETTRQIAEYRTFQNNSMLSKGADKAREGLNKFGAGLIGRKWQQGQFGLGTALMPYTKVPTNLAMKAVEFSPVGALNGLREMVSVLNDPDATMAQQNKAVTDFGRGVTGTALVAAMAMLMKQVKFFKDWDDEEDKDVKAQNRAEGKYGMQFNLDMIKRWANGDKDPTWQNGDRTLDISSMEPLNQLIGAASLIAEQEEFTLGGVAEAFTKAAHDSLNNMPALQTLANIEDTIRYTDTPDDLKQTLITTAASTAGSVAGGMIPAPIKHYAALKDENVRDTSGNNAAERAVNQAKSAIPGLRQTLPVKRDAFGNEMKAGDFATRFANQYDAFKHNQVNQSDVSRELERLREATDEVLVPSRNGPSSVTYGSGKNKETVKLTNKEKQEYKNALGKDYEKSAQQLMQDPVYQLADDETKAAMLKEIESFSKDTAKMNLAEDRDIQYESPYANERELDDPVAFLTAKTGFNTAKKDDDWNSIDSLLDTVRESRLTEEQLDYYEEHMQGFKRLYAMAADGVGSKRVTDFANSVKDLYESEKRAAARGSDYIRIAGSGQFTDKEADVFMNYAPDVSQKTVNRYKEQIQYQLSQAGMSGAYDAVWDGIEQVVNGDLDSAAFKKWVDKNVPLEQRQEIKDVCSNYAKDRHESGKTVAGIYNAMREVGYTAQQALQFYELIDTNYNGYYTKKEFDAACKKAFGSNWQSKDYAKQVRALIKQYVGK